MRSIVLTLVIGFLWIPRSGADNTTPTPAPIGEQALFEDLPVVEAASLHVQSLKDAPANVTVISAADIRKYGYRTLAEALAGVRGFDISYDRIYHYAGVHGFSLPGDYNTRFLVMLNGHALTENIFDSNNFFGQDFGLDMDLVQRIEVIRGPSAALYGSNGMFATINVVTKSPVDQPQCRFSSETGSFGEKKGLLSSSLYLGRGANLLVSASVFHNRGQNHYFPEYDSPDTNNGVAGGADGERGYHTFANLIWRGWDFVAFFNSREKKPPVAWDDDAIFASRGNRVRDKDDFVRLLHSRDVGVNGRFRWQVSYDRLRYQDRFDSKTADGVQDMRNIALGDWTSGQADYSFPVAKLGLLTIGAQATWNLRNLQRNYAVTPVYAEELNVNHPNQKYGVFAQQELALSARWKAYAGLRFDAFHSLASTNSLSPRFALLFERSPKVVYKFVYGHPFRNPSAFEQYYSGASTLPSGPLRPERADTLELSIERKLGADLTGIVNVYSYETRNLIQVAYVEEGLQQYRNSDHLNSSGVELELSGKAWGWLDTVASLAFQRTLNRTTGSRLPNSPRQVGKVRMALPLWRNKVTLSGSAQYLGSRDTLAGDTVRPFFLADTTVTTHRLFEQFDLQFGVRNLFDRIYYDPVALAIDRMRGDGRSAYVKLIVRSRE